MRTDALLGEAGLSMLFSSLWNFRSLVLVLNHSSRTWGDSVDFSMGIYLDWNVSLKPADEIQQSCWHGGIAPSALEFHVPSALECFIVFTLKSL